jgi:hypothetical protein
VASALVLATAGVLAVMAFLYYEPAPSVLVASGSEEAMGTAQGKELRTRIRLLTELYLHRVVCRGDARVVREREARALEALKHWPEAYQEELRAVAKAANVEPGSIAYANQFLDMGNARGACRSVVLLATNGLLHAHNLDWDSLGGLGRWTTTILRRNPSDGRFRTVSVGFPGLVGSLDIINEKGLAISFNQFGMANGPYTEPVWLMARRIAETCASLNEARQRVLSAPPGMPFILTVSDASAGQAAVFERMKRVITERPLREGSVSACNQAQGEESGVTRLDQKLAADRIASTEELRALLAHSEVMLVCNLYSVIFNYRDNSLLISSGHVPAAERSPRKFVLFPK